MCGVPSEAACRSSCCNGEGGGCAARAGVRMLCRSGRKRTASLQYGGPDAPSGPA